MRTDRALGVFVLLVGLVWVTIAGLTLFWRLPLNPVSIDLGKYGPVKTVAAGIRGVMPQGWAFFTRSPREPDLFPFVKRGGRWVRASRGPHSHPAHAFGLNRISRSQAIESALLLRPVPATAWQGCRQLPEACLEKLARTLPLANVSPRPTLCGTVGFARQQPIPWAWSRSAVTMPSRVVRLEVNCEPPPAKPG